jgi:hypothetical protein
MTMTATTRVTTTEHLYALQVTQLEHDEMYHKDVVIMPLAERVKHMALHNAKYTGYLVEALDAQDDERMQRILTDAFIITLATANTLNQDLGKEVAFTTNGSPSLRALGTVLAAESAAAGNDPFAFVKAYARQAGALAKACESWDHMESLPYRDLMRQSNLALFKLIVAEAATRQFDLDSLYIARLRVVECRSIFERSYTAKSDPR